MAPPEQHFDASNLETVLDQWVGAPASTRILILLEGPARALSDDVRLRSTADGLVQVRAGSRGGLRALGIAFLAEGGRVETADDPRGGRDGGGWAPFGPLASEARVWAASILDLARPLGGLGAVLRLDADQLVRQAGLPELAARIGALADGRRTVARVLGDAGVDELLAARVLNRLFLEGALQPLGPDDEHDPLIPAPRAEGSHFSMPRQGWGDTSALPETDAEEFEGVAVATDVGEWLVEEAAPPTLLSDEAFLGAYSQGEAPASEPAPVAAFAPPSDEPTSPPTEASRPPAAVEPDAEPPTDETPAPAPESAPAAVEPDAAQRVRETIPYTTRRPGPAEDDDMLREAGVGGGGVPWWVLGALLVFLVAAIALMTRGGGSDGPPDSGLAIAPIPTSTVATATVATATVATATVAETPSPDGLRPTVAAPDAPEAVRDAEALVEGERYREAERALARLRRTRPDDPAVHILSGMVYVDTNRLAKAGRMADRALRLDRRSFRAWVLKGSVLQFQRKDARALAAYQRALELGPDHPMSNQLRAVVSALERRLR